MSELRQHASDAHDEKAIAKQIASALLEIDAVTLRPKDPFTWSSGMKSPIYCDNRLTISYPHVRRLIADGFTKRIQAMHPDVEVIAGTSTSGIPHAAWIAERMNLPMVYVRGSAKGHGKQNQVEGLLKAGQKTIVIEDLISTGGSAIKAAKAVKEAGGEVLCVAAIFTYELAAASRNFAEANLPYFCLSNFSTLIDEAVSMNRIDEEDMELLIKWRQNPESYQAGN